MKAANDKKKSGRDCCHGREIIILLKIPVENVNITFIVTKSGIGKDLFLYTLCMIHW